MHVNHPPELSLPGDSQVFEDNEDEDGVEGTLVFSEDLGNGISISDPDAYSDSSTIEVKIELVDENDDAVVDRGTFSFVLDGVTVLDLYRRRWSECSLHNLSWYVSCRQHIH